MIILFITFRLILEKQTYLGFDFFNCELLVGHCIWTNGQECFALALLNFIYSSWFAARKNDVMFVNNLHVCFSDADDLGLHRVANNSNVDTAVTLHLYSPPFDECCIFDEKTGHQNKAKMTFWSKYGKRTPFVSTVFLAWQLYNFRIRQESCHIM